MSKTGKIVNGAIKGIPPWMGCTMMVYAPDCYSEVPLRIRVSWLGRSANQ